MGLGFWYDYWLFLHADETHGIWSSRPLGLTSIAEMSRDLHPSVDRVLTEAIAAELEGYRRLSAYLPIAPPVSEGLIKVRGGHQIASDWQDWLKEAGSPENLAALMSTFRQALEDAVEAADVPTIAFLSRRLSSELSSLIPSKRVLVQRALSCLRSEDALTTREILDRVATQPPDREFVVRFKVGPVPVSTRFFRVQTAPPSTRLVIEAPPADQPGEPAKLTGIDVRVLSCDPEHALIDALRDCRETLHQLRVRHYIRTHLIHAARVEHCGDGRHTWLSLEQPFWTPKSGRRALPRLPPKFHRLRTRVGPAAGMQWNAMRWHVSQAIAHWPEDIHGAASQVWQAIEGFAGGRDHVGEGLIEDYLTCLRGELLEYLATRLSFQRSAYYRATGGCDWRGWDVTKVASENWAARIYDRRSSNYHGTWKKPAAPALLFDQEVGLLRTVWDCYRGRRTPGWMRRRCALDFDHLYAIRNAVVHKGTRVGGDRWAAHLGRLGLECILSVARVMGEALEASSVEGGPAEEREA
jgi:hypothetical protein